MVKGILIFILCFSILYLLREGLEFFRALKNGTYEITKAREIGAGLAISYIITIICTGI